MPVITLTQEQADFITSEIIPNNCFFIPEKAWAYVNGVDYFRYNDVGVLMRPTREQRRVALWEGVKIVDLATSMCNAN